MLDVRCWRHLFAPGVSPGPSASADREIRAEWESGNIRFEPDLSRCATGDSHILA